MTQIYAWNDGYAMARWRRTYPALRRGDFNLRWTTTRTGDESDAGILAFDRQYEGQYALVVINAQGNHPSETRSPENTAMTVGAAAGTVLVDLVTGDRFTVGADQTLVVEVDVFGTRLLVPEDQVVAE